MLVGSSFSRRYALQWFRNMAWNTSVPFSRNERVQMGVYKVSLWKGDRPIPRDRPDVETPNPRARTTDRRKLTASQLTARTTDRRDNSPSKAASSYAAVSQRKRALCVV